MNVLEEKESLEIDETNNTFFDKSKEQELLNEQMTEQLLDDVVVNDEEDFLFNDDLEGQMDAFVLENREGQERLKSIRLS